MFCPFKEVLCVFCSHSESSERLMYSLKLFSHRIADNKQQIQTNQLSFGSSEFHQISIHKITMAWHMTEKISSDDVSSGKGEQPIEFTSMLLLLSLVDCCCCYEKKWLDYH